MSERAPQTLAGWKAISGRHVSSPHGGQLCLAHGEPRSTGWATWPAHRECAPVQESQEHAHSLWPEFGKSFMEEDIPHRENLTNMIKSVQTPKEA